MSTKKDIYDVTGHPIPFDISCTIQNIMLPMRDGIKLHTAVYFPPELRKKAPVLLVRSPYNQQGVIIPPDARANTSRFSSSLVMSSPRVL